MDEQKQYEVIKSLAEHPTPNKQRTALTLGCTVRHISRRLKGYKKQGKEFSIRGNRGWKPANTIPELTRNLVLNTLQNCWENTRIYIYPSSVQSILEAKFILSPKVTKAKKKSVEKQLRAKNETVKTPKEAYQIRTNLVAVENAHSRHPRAAYFGELGELTTNIDRML